MRWAADRRWRSRSSALFLVLPLAAVFVEAFAQGLGAYFDGHPAADEALPRSG